MNSHWKRKLGEDVIIQRYLSEEFDMLAENLPRILEQERMQRMEQGIQQGSQRVGKKLPCGCVEGAFLFKM